MSSSKTPGIKRDDDISEASASPTSRSEDGQQNAGIFDNGFEAYITVTDDDYLRIFNSGLIVLDANVLLDLYRYHPKARKEFLNVLERIQERLWVPNQAMSEFWSHREGVLEDSKDIIGTVNDLNKFGDQYATRVRKWANRAGLDRDTLNDLLDITRSAFKATSANIRKLGADETLETAKDTETDSVVNRLSSILKDRVGKPMAPEQRRIAIKEEAPKRFAQGRPPGYKDANKKQGEPAGDYLVWIEMLEEAKRRGLDVLFVTDDTKEDWWRIERNQLKGPAPQLVEEMRNYANVRLFMLRPASLLKHVSDLLKVKVSQEAVQDVRRVSRQVSISWNTAADPESELLQLAKHLVSIVAVTDQSEPGTKVSEVLSEPVARLYATITTENALGPILDAIWPVIEAANYRGIITKGTDSKPPSDLERQAWETVDELREEATRRWLDNVADQVMAQNPNDPEFGLDEIPLPPIVASIGVEPITWDADGVGQVEFFVSLTDSDHEVFATRVVPLPGHAN
jgi:hypothetical protein